MCNLYSITTKQAAIIALFRVMDRYVAAQTRARSMKQVARRHESALAFIQQQKLPPIVRR
jgi:hypothetical protein